MWAILGATVWPQPTGDVHALCQHTHKDSVQLLTFLRQQLLPGQNNTARHRSIIPYWLRVTGIEFGQLQ